ncbi:MAG: type 2 isopentenyl-diphosphate Delta-isomerase [Candidatus Micrarchaeota archaeon]
MASDKTEKRKGSHVRVCLGKNVEACCKNAGFEDVEFLHVALPELDLERLSTQSRMLGKKLDAPIVIEAMTGGYEEGKKINLALAEAAEEEKVALGLGSMRAMLENEKLTDTYAVREVAPKIPIIGNIGIPQLKEGDWELINKALMRVEADALAVHINPLQEAIQKEGDKNFELGIKAIEKACEKITIPVIAKETGAGITREVAEMLEAAGVSMIDVAGVGGTSWSAVEQYRDKNAASGFEEWGLTTAHSIVEASSSVEIPVIGSGGVRSGVDIAKCIALGAQYGGAALPFLKVWEKKGAEGVKELLREWKMQLKIAMFLTGSRDLEALGNAKIIIMGRTSELLEARGYEVKKFSERK